MNATPDPYRLAGRIVHNVTRLDEPPSFWLKSVRQGKAAHDCTNCLLHLNGGTRLVYSDAGGLHVRFARRVYLSGDLLAKVEHGLQVWRAADVERVKPRRKRSECQPMPETLSACHVEGLHQWPMGSVMVTKAEGEGWTDCIVSLIEPIRVGGQFNSRRVRYDGRFYITWRGRRVYLVGELAWRAWDTVTHVYGFDSDADAKHNKTLKGY